MEHSFAPTVLASIPWSDKSLLKAREFLQVLKASGRMGKGAERVGRDSFESRRVISPSV